MSDPEAYKVVADMMIHGPCGNAKPNAPCMQEGGTDRIVARIVKSTGDPGPSTSVPKIQIDEMKIFIDGRFLCPHESYWRILDFPIHHREPPVQILAVHLHDMQHITFGEKEPLKRIITDDGRKLTTLTQWFAYNASFADGRHLTYLDFPFEYAWFEDTTTWKRRKSKTRYSIGRLVYVYPAAGELFYFRMLLTHQKGCKSFIDVRTVNGRVFSTYRAACEAMGLLEDDREWYIALVEASTRASSPELRMLFSHILIYCEVSNPLQLWEKHWRSMAEDIPQKASQTSGVKNLHVNDPEIKNFILYEIEIILNRFSTSIKEFGFSLPPDDLL